ncbi:MAG: zinc ribbon domain-containing protein [Actinomycetota bacterium]|nr:zinc ribbon domain-containing protein [Actinomycetota bacterium]
MNELHAPEKLRCPSCGAKNPPDAQWCGQCLKRFDAPPPPPPVAETGRAPAPPGEDRPQVKPGVEHGSFRSTEEGILWRCSSCDNENRLEEQTCAVCGTPFAESVRPPAPARPERDPGTTAMISLFFPGAGHAYLGMWAQAVARGVVSVWVVLMALFFAIGGEGRSMPFAALYGVAAFGLWGAAAHDAYREANGEPKQILLYGRRFTYLVLGLLMLLLASLFLTAFSNR